MEVAASLRERGLDVTVIGREAVVPFEKQLGREVAPLSSACMRSAASPSAPRVAPPRWRAARMCAPSGSRMANAFRPTL
jgi:hypothetical protein